MTIGDYLRYEIIHLVPTQNFPKNYYLSPPNTDTVVCVTGGKEC